MHITVDKKDLLKLASHAQAVADRKGVMPFLSSVLIEAHKPDAVSLSATDLYVSTSGTIPADVLQTGKVAVPARDLAERTKMMPDGPVCLRLENENSVLFKAEGSKLQYRLRCMPGHEFPALPAPPASANRMRIPAAAMANLISHTHFSISQDDSRPNLHSAQLEWDGSQVRMVTTDGHRLSLMQMTIPDSQAKATMLLPLKAVVELRRLAEEAMSDLGKDVMLSVVDAGSTAFFELPGATFGVKLVDAQFPQYRQVIPNETPRKLVARRGLLQNALRAVSVAASDKTDGVKLTLSMDTLHLTSESPESGDGTDEIPVEYSDSPLTIGFNARYLLDVISAIHESDLVEMGLSEELDPAVLRPVVQPEGCDYIAVVMPMRV